MDAVQKNRQIMEELQRQLRRPEGTVEFHSSADLFKSPLNVLPWCGSSPDGMYTSVLRHTARESALGATMRGGTYRTGRTGMYLGELLVVGTTGQFFSRNGFLSSPCQLRLASGSELRKVATNEDYDTIGSRVHLVNDEY